MAIKCEKKEKKNREKARVIDAGASTITVILDFIDYMHNYYAI